MFYNSWVSLHHVNYSKNNIKYSNRQVKITIGNSLNIQFQGFSWYMLLPFWVVLRTAMCSL